MFTLFKNKVADIENFVNYSLSQICVIPNSYSIAEQSKWYVCFYQASQGFDSCVLELTCDTKPQLPFDFTDVKNNKLKIINFLKENVTVPSL